MTTANRPADRLTTTEPGHGGDRVAAVLRAHGVKTVFTLCGGHISPILSAARRIGLRIIDTRHEATAVFAADATARITGVPGVAAVTAGPGLTNTITAVKNAQLAQSPVVVLGGATATILKGRGALQDIDQVALMKPHVKKCFVVRRVRDLAGAVDQAFAVARSGVPGPVFVECPVDLLYPEALVRDWYGADKPGKGLAGKAQQTYIRHHLARVFAPAGGAAHASASPPPAVDDQRVRDVAARVASARKPVLIVGSQAVCDAATVEEVADAVKGLGIPTWLSGMARGLLGADHATLHRHRRRQALRDADLVILAGVPCDFRLDYGRHIGRDALLVSANRGHEDMSLNRRPNIGVLADAGQFLIALNRCSGGGDWSEWATRLDERDAERERGIDADATRTGDLVNPLALCRGIDAALPNDSVIVADGGDFVGTASYILRPRGPLRWLDPGVFGTLGVGAGFALGAAVSRPGAEIWALFGDGSLGYSLAEFDTFVRHAIPIIAVVGNDACWSQIAREQLKILNDDVAVMLHQTDYHRVVGGLGASGIVVHDDEEIADVLQQARDIADGGHPVLVNALLDRSDFREGSISI